MNYLRLLWCLFLNRGRWYLLVCLECSLFEHFKDAIILLATLFSKEVFQILGHRRVTLKCCQWSHCLGLNLWFFQSSLYLNFGLLYLMFRMLHTFVFEEALTQLHCLRWSLLHVLFRLVIESVDSNIKRRLMAIHLLMDGRLIDYSNLLLFKLCADLFRFILANVYLLHRCLLLIVTISVSLFFMRVLMSDTWIVLSRRLLHPLIFDEDLP